MNKKAQLGKQMTYFILVMIALIITGLLMSLIFFDYQQSAISTPDDTFVEMYWQRFAGSPGCFAYQDAFTGRTLTGVLDMSKVLAQDADKILDHCYNALEPQLGFEYLVQDVDVLVLQPIRLRTSNFVFPDKTFPARFVWLRQDDGSLHRGNVQISLSRKRPT